MSLYHIVIIMKYLVFDREKWFAKIIVSVTEETVKKLYGHLDYFALNSFENVPLWSSIIDRYEEEKSDIVWYIESRWILWDLWYENAEQYLDDFVEWDEFENSQYESWYLNGMKEMIDIVTHQFN